MYLGYSNAHVRILHIYETRSRYTARHCALDNAFSRTKVTANEIDSLVCAVKSPLIGHFCNLHIKCSSSPFKISNVRACTAHTIVDMGESIRARVRPVGVWNGEHDKTVNAPDRYLLLSPQSARKCIDNVFRTILIVFLKKTCAFFC